MDMLPFPAAFFRCHEPRRARILEGAMQVFLSYGFQRTTMDDIARAAEISRPALYLVFRNKTDIYRALATDFLNASLEKSQAELATPAPLAQRLCASIECLFGMMREVEASPHGAEILDMKSSLAADVVADGRARFAALVVAAMDGEVAKLGLPGCDTATLTDLLLDALDGMKLRGLPTQEQLRLTPAYVDMVVGALGRG